MANRTFLAHVYIRTDVTRPTYELGTGNSMEPREVDELARTIKIDEAKAAKDLRDMSQAHTNKSLSVKSLELVDSRH